MSELFQLREELGSAEELLERVVEHARGQEVTYLGTQGPYRKGSQSFDPWPVHVWRIGPYVDPVNPDYVVPATVEKAAREDKSVVYRREVWTGSGESVPLLNMSRGIEKALEAYPAPLRTSQEPLSEPVPAPVAKLLSTALSAGWEGIVTHAQGRMPHATHGRPGAIKISYAVRLKRDDQRAVAVRHGATWGSFWYWTRSSFFQRAATLAQFEGWIA